MPEQPDPVKLRATYGDDWRDHMPLAWHVGRGWSIWWPVLVPCMAALVAGALVLAVGGWL